MGKEVLAVFLSLPRYLNPSIYSSFCGGADSEGNMATPVY